MKTRLDSITFSKDKDYCESVWRERCMLTFEFITPKNNFLLKDAANEIVKALEELLGEN